VPVARFRRSPTLVSYWQDDACLLHNYATGRMLPASGALLDLLSAFSSWRGLEDYRRSLPAPSRALAGAVVEGLHRERFLWRQGEPLSPHEASLSGWGGWNPSAGFFHAATRNPTVVDLETVISTLRKQAKRDRPPAPTKRLDAGARLALPPPADAGAFGEVVRGRRTWRHFGRAALSLAALSTLLDHTVGVQQWVHAVGEGRVPLKTSPSGGARHPIEAYVAVRRVAGLRPGFYHYDAEGHELVRVVGRAAPPPFDDLLPTQWWYRGASALIFFCAVFARTRWRYPGPRAYRAVLIEAGHVCQTFCLTATALGLAPFCSMATADARIERALGIDGIDEAVVYAAGVGTRPVRSGRDMPGMMPAGGRRVGRSSRR
jgi:SagB-type dehydrogenase family enzyme